MIGNTLALCVYLPLKHILVVSPRLGLGCLNVNFWAIQLIMECLQLYGLLLCFWYFCCSSRVLKPHSVLFQYLLPDTVLDQLISLKDIPTIQPNKKKLFFFNYLQVRFILSCFLMMAHTIWRLMYAKNDTVGKTYLPISWFLHEALLSFALV